MSIELINPERGSVFDIRLLPFQRRDYFDMRRVRK